MVIIATVFAMIAIYCIIIGLKEAIRTALLGNFDTACLTMIMIGIIAGVLTVLLALWIEKRGRKKRTKEEIERDTLLETNKSCTCSRCGINLKLIPAKDIKRDIKWINGQLYCAVCASNMPSEQLNKQED